MPRQGRKHSEQAKGRMRAAKLGTRLPEAHRAAISAGVRTWWEQRKKEQGEPKAPDAEPSEGNGPKRPEPSTARELAFQRQRVQRISYESAKPPPRYDRAA